MDYLINIERYLPIPFYINKKPTILPIVGLLYFMMMDYFFVFVENGLLSILGPHWHREECFNFFIGVPHVSQTFATIIPSSFYDHINIILPPL